MGFGAETLTEQYQSPAGAALCVINDPPPLGVTDPNPIGTTNVVRSWNFSLTAVHEINENSPIQCLGSIIGFGGALQNGFRVFIGDGITGAFPNASLVVLAAENGVSGNFAINSPIPAGVRAITIIMSSSSRQIWVDGVQKSVEEEGTGVNWQTNTFATVGGAAESDSSAPTYNSLTEHLMHRFRTGQEAYFPEQIAEFASGGFPTTTFDYEFPCSTS